MDLTESVIGMAIYSGALIGLAAGLLTLLTDRIMTGSGMTGSFLGKAGS